MLSYLQSHLMLLTAHTTPADEKSFSACMQGAIYVTDNAAYSWTAAVQETVDATLNRTVSSGEPKKACLEAPVKSGNSIDQGYICTEHALMTAFAC